MFNGRIKSLYDNNTICNHFMILWAKVLKLPLWQIMCLQHEKVWLSHIMWIWILRVVLKNSRTYMVVMELVSQQLDEYKNDGVISKLNEILLGQIWVCWLVYSGGATHMGGGGGGQCPPKF